MPHELHLLGGEGSIDGSKLDALIFAHLRPALLISQVDDSRASLSPIEDCRTFRFIGVGRPATEQPAANGCRLGFTSSQCLRKDPFTYRGPR
jgi:hypothetical protein